MVAYNNGVGMCRFLWGLEEGRGTEGEAETGAMTATVAEAEAKTETDTEAKTGEGRVGGSRG